MKETAASVFVREKRWGYNGDEWQQVRHAKASEHAQYHRSEREAVEYLLERERRNVAYAKDKLQRARTSLGQVESAARKMGIPMIGAGV